MAQEAQGQTDAQLQKGQGDYDQVLNTLQQMARNQPPPAPLGGPSAGGSPGGAGTTPGGGSSPTSTGGGGGGGGGEGGGTSCPTDDPGCDAGTNFTPVGQHFPTPVVLASSISCFLP